MSEVPGIITVQGSVKDIDGENPENADKYNFD